MANAWRNFPDKDVRLLWKEVPGWDEALSAFGDTQDPPSLTCYPAPGDEKHGAVLVIPGGGYCMKAMHEAEPIALMCNRAGLSAYVLNYRVSPYRYPCPQADGFRALRWLRYHSEELYIWKDKIAVLGFSAGGHLAASLATAFACPPCLQQGDPVDNESSRPDAAILCYPVISMQPGLTHMGSRDALLGMDFIGDDTPFCADKQVTDNTPPCFLWHTADDSTVPVSNTMAMTAALIQHNVYCETHIYPHGSHGLGLAENNSQVGTWPSLAMKFLRSLGFMD